MTYAAPTSHVQTNSALDELLEMLTYKRPAGSRTEVDFIERFIMPLPGATVDSFGNIWLDVGDEEPNIMWSSHTDTVHHTEGRQKVIVDRGFASVRVEKLKPSSEELDRCLKIFMRTGVAPKLPRGEKSTNCLGADCTTGVWLMIEMIKAGQPGRYVFHREEEVGGNGSDHIAKNESHLLKGIDFCIALDRKGYGDIITHQMVGRTASNAFAASMAEILGGDFRACDGGTFTDSANYADIVPECTNLSIGYFAQHGPTEEQDLGFADEMREILTTADFSTLVVGRDPYSRPASTNLAYGGWDDQSYTPTYRRTNDEDEETEMAELIFNHPEAIARWFITQAFTSLDIEEIIQEN